MISAHTSARMVQASGKEPAVAKPGRIGILLRRLASDNSGVTIVEFAIILVPMLLLLLGGLDLGYQSYVRAVTQGALYEAARQAAVENPELGYGGDTIEKQVENKMLDILEPLTQDAVITISAETYFDFSGIGNPEKLLTDFNKNGIYDELDGDCFEDRNSNGDYDLSAAAGSGRGGASDVALYTANITMPRLLSWHAFSSAASETMEIEVETAIRTQPFADQAEPPVVCGDIP